MVFVSHCLTVCIDVSHCWILSPDKTEWWLISATRCFVADQLWLMKHIQEEEVVFANLKRVIQCACFKSPGSRKGTLKCNLHILAVAQHLLRKWRLVSSSSLQREHNGLLTFRIIVRCRLRILCPVRRYTSVLRSRWHCRKANCVSPGVTQVTVV